MLFKKVKYEKVKANIIDEWGFSILPKFVPIEVELDGNRYKVNKLIVKITYLSDSNKMYYIWDYLPIVNGTDISQHSSIKLFNGTEEITNPYQIFVSGNNKKFEINSELEELFELRYNKFNNLYISNEWYDNKIKPKDIGGDINSSYYMLETISNNENSINSSYVGINGIFNTMNITRRKGFENEKFSGLPNKFDLMYRIKSGIFSSSSKYEHFLVPKDFKLLERFPEIDYSLLNSEYDYYQTEEDYRELEMMNYMYH